MMFNETMEKYLDGFFVGSKMMKEMTPLLWEIEHFGRELELSYTNEYVYAYDGLGIA